MILKKKYLTLFYKTLAEARTDVAKNHISLADARIRDALASKAVFEHLKDFETARKVIYEEFCYKNEDGSPEVVGENYVYSHTATPTQEEKEKIKKMSEEVKLLEEEEVDIAIQDPAKIKLFLNNTKYEPQVGETIVIDEIIALIA